MRRKTILYCGIFIFLTSLFLTFLNLLRSGILQMFFQSENTAGIGSIGGGMFRLMLFALPVLGMLIGSILIVVGIFTSFKKNSLP